MKKEEWVTNKSEKKTWLVHMECVVIRDVVIGPCTLEHAWGVPWDYCEEKPESLIDYEVISVREVGEPQEIGGAR